MERIIRGISNWETERKRAEIRADKALFAYVDPHPYEGGWRRRTIDWQSQPAGGRNLETYENRLRFKRESLAGKKVLDLGTGPATKLSRELAASDIGATVISLSPDFIYPEYRTMVNNGGVAGLGQSLPFANEVFDSVLVLNVLEHLESEGDYLSIIREISRVLSKGGEARIGPTPYIRLYLKLIEKDLLTRNFLEDQHVTTSIQEIPEEHFQTKIYENGDFGFLAGGHTLILNKEANIQTIYGSGTGTRNFPPPDL